MTLKPMLLCMINIQGRELYFSDFIETKQSKKPKQTKLACVWTFTDQTLYDDRYVLLLCFDATFNDPDVNSKSQLFEKAKLFVIMLHFSQLIWIKLSILPWSVCLLNLMLSLYGVKLDLKRENSAWVILYNICLTLACVWCLWIHFFKPSLMLDMTKLYSLNDPDLYSRMWGNVKAGTCTVILFQSGMKYQLLIRLDYEGRWLSEVP